MQVSRPDIGVMATVAVMAVRVAMFIRMRVIVVMPASGQKPRAGEIDAKPGSPASQVASVKLIATARRAAAVTAS